MTNFVLSPKLRSIIALTGLSSVILFLLGCSEAESETPEVVAEPPHPTASTSPAALPAFDPTQGGDAIFQSVCATCHGDKGQGNQDLKAPSIASQPSWFVTLQLEKFREGHRGTGDASDTTGAMMRAISLTLTPETIPKIADYVQSMTPVPTTTERTGDRARGEELFMEVCAQCHRYNAQGEKVFRSAPLTTLPDWYIEESLRKFKAGLRGYNHGDLDGPKMQEIAQLLGEEEINDLILHIASLAERYPPGVTRRGTRQVPQ